MYKFEEVENKDGFYITVNVRGSSATAFALSEQFDNFFCAIKPCEIMEVREVHSTGTGTLNIERLSGTEALDAGDTILKSNIALTSTENTVIVKKKEDLQNTKLEVGDRLALKDGGVLTETQNINVTIYLKPLGKGDYR